MSKYGWIIDKDEEGRIIPVMGPSGISPDMIRRLMNGEGEKFRMYDGDGELYYEGRIIHDESSTGYEPLDDYGRGNAGCVAIMYLVNGNWEEL